jgi:hypothetical protein
MRCEWSFTIIHTYPPMNDHSQSFTPTDLWMIIHNHSRLLTYEWSFTIIHAYPPINEHSQSFTPTHIWMIIHTYPPTDDHSQSFTPTHLWRWNRYSVPKRRLITLRRRGTAQKTIYCIQNTAKVRKLKVYLLKIQLSKIWNSENLKKN